MDRIEVKCTLIGVTGTTDRLQPTLEIHLGEVTVENDALFYGDGTPPLVLPCGAKEAREATRLLYEPNALKLTLARG